MREFVGKCRYYVAVALFVLASSVLSTGQVFANPNNNSQNHTPTGNNGTLKVHEIGTPSGTESNDPKVCAFNFEGFGFDASQSGYINIDGQGQTTTNYDNQFPLGPTDAAGYAISQDFNNGVGTLTIADGHYKATLYGKDTGGHINLSDVKAKSKVFKVECAAVQPTQVTPDDVMFTDVCGTASDTYTIPATAGVDYQINGSTVASGAYPAAGTVTVTAVAQTGYTLDGTANWSQTFTDVPCVVQVTPTSPSYTKPDCEVSNMLVTPPAITGVIWFPSGSTTLQPGESVTYTATPDQNYVFSQGATTSWTFTNEFDPADCEEVLPTEVAPAAVDFTDPTCTATGSYTVPAKTGVIYKDGNGKVVAAGTYAAIAGQTVTITAYPADSSYVLTGTTTWSHTFAAAKDCNGHVLGDTTTTPPTALPTGQVLAANTQSQLADTGTSPILPTLFAMLMLSTAVVVTRYKRTN